EGGSDAESRFFVQWVIRHDGSGPRALRGYSGQLSGGIWRVGDPLRVLPSEEPVRIARILRGDEELEAARDGDSVTLVLDRDIDVSRGDLLVGALDPVRSSRDFEADLCWLDQQALNPSRLYWLKQGTRLTQARVQA